MVYGFFQVTDILDEYSTFKIYGSHCHAKGFLGNANAFGTQCLVNLCLSIGLFIKTRNKYYILLFLTFTFGMFISGTMGCILTFILILIFLFIYILFYNKKNIKRNIIYGCSILVLITLCFILVSSFSKKDLVGDVFEMFTQIVDVSRGKIEDNYGTGRIYIWKNTLEVVPKYLIHGVGIDRFAYAFGDGFLILPDTGAMIDKAHNEYLQILVTEGIFALITYICFLIIIIKNAFKYIKHNKTLIPLLIALIAYLIQAFFNISITRLSPIIFILMGLLYTRFKADKNNEIKKSIKSIE